MLSHAQSETNINASGNKNHHTYSKRESPEVTHNNMDTLSTTYPIKSKLHVAKKMLQ
jgi:hypothetical protein